jgi:hypothetical protein
MLQQLGLVQAETSIVTTVHPLQLVEPEQLPMRAHDWSLTWIVMPDEAIATPSQRVQPTGLLWDQVRPEQFTTIPVLRTLRPDQPAEVKRTGIAPRRSPEKERTATRCAAAHLLCSKFLEQLDDVSIVMLPC